MGARPWPGRGSAPLMKVPDPPPKPDRLPGDVALCDCTSQSWGSPPSLKVGHETSHGPEPLRTPCRGSKHPEDVVRLAGQKDRQKKKWMPPMGDHPHHCRGRHHPATPDMNVPEKEPTPQVEPVESPHPGHSAAWPRSMGEAWMPVPSAHPADRHLSCLAVCIRGTHPLVHLGALTASPLTLRLVPPLAPRSLRPSPGGVGRRGPGGGLRPVPVPQWSPNTHAPLPR